MDRLRGPRPVVVADVLDDDAPDMVRTQEEEITGPDLVGVVVDERAPGLLLARDAGSADSDRSRLPSPEQPETLTMPPDDRVGLDDDQRTGPPGPGFAEEDPENPILGREPWSSMSSLVGGELLA
jgi:hypothetical protein